MVASMALRALALALAARAVSGGYQIGSSRSDTSCAADDAVDYQGGKLLQVEASLRRPQPNSPGAHKVTSGGLPVSAPHQKAAVLMHKAVKTLDKIASKLPAKAVGKQAGKVPAKGSAAKLATKKAGTAPASKVVAKASALPGSKRPKAIRIKQMLKAKPKSPAKAGIAPARELVVQKVQQKTGPSKVQGKPPSRPKHKSGAAAKPVAATKMKLAFATKGKIKTVQPKKASMKLVAGKLKAHETFKRRALHKKRKVHAELDQEMEEESEAAMQQKTMTGTLFNPVISSVIILMSAPAGLLLLAFGAFLWVK